MPAQTSRNRAVAKYAGGVFAAGLLGWGGFVLLAGRVPQVCHDEVVSSGSGRAAEDLVVRLCEPMSAGDPRVLLFLLVLVLCLLPLFSEIEVAGLFRVRKQVEEAERDVRDLRESVRTAQSQVATLTSAAAASAAARANSESRVEYHHHDHRGEASGEVQRQVLSGSPRVGVSAGAYAQAAFTAGLVGLETLLVLREPEVLMFFTVADDGTYELSQSVGDGENPEVLAAALTAVNADPGGTSAGWVGEQLLVTAPALDDASLPVGAVAAVFGQGGPALHAQEIPGLLADVSNVAGAYARLLVDLLGEAGRMAAGADEATEGP